MYSEKNYNPRDNFLLASLTNFLPETFFESAAKLKSRSNTLSYWSEIRQQIFIGYYDDLIILLIIIIKQFKENKLCISWFLSWTGMLKYGIFAVKDVQYFWLNKVFFQIQIKLSFVSRPANQRKRSWRRQWA